jgi:hypothetical protein
MVVVVAEVAQQLQAGLAEEMAGTELVMELAVAVEAHALQHLELLVMVAMERKDL